MQGVAAPSKASSPAIRLSRERNLYSFSLLAMQRILIIAGIVLLLAGFAWPWLSKLPFGRLPGDIHVVREGFSFHFPIVTCAVTSVVLTLLFWIFRR